MAQPHGYAQVAGPDILALTSLMASARSAKGCRMLSIDHPHLMGHLKLVRYGLLPVIVDSGEHFLIVKATKEGILAARHQGGFKVYLLSDRFERHLGLVTAFFEDHDEPLILATALFDGDELTGDIDAVLSQPEFKVYFVDEQDRELMGVRVANPSADRFRETMAGASFEPLDLDTFGRILERLGQRFSIRDAADDEAAFALSVLEHLYPGDLAIVDTRPAANGFHGAHLRPAFTELVSEDPGPPQERDIAVMLARVFPPEDIYLNPFRADTDKELIDLLVVTDKVMLFIEAKDSPNTPASLDRTLDRKRRTIQNQIVKATKQLKGALTYAQSAGGVMIEAEPESLTLPLAGRQLLGLVVIREMFDDSQVANSAPILDMVDEIQMPLMLIDYPGLHMMSLSLRTPAQFIAALHSLFDAALEHGQFPRSIWSAPPLID
jgi:hypothetical protein